MSNTLTDEAGEEELPLSRPHDLHTGRIPPQPRQDRLPRLGLVTLALDRNNRAGLVDAHGRIVQVVELVERLAVHERAEEQLISGFCLVRRHPRVLILNSGTHFSSPLVRLLMRKL